MNAFIPGKDTELFLKNFQTDFIKFFSESKKIMMYPEFPLFALMEDDCKIDFSLLEECFIQTPEFEKGNFYFPVQLKSKNFSLTLKIIFATTKDKDFFLTTDFLQDFFSASKSYEKTFPKKEKSFRAGQIIFSQNSWQIFDDKWYKIHFAE